ncbi:prepilin-type N-terminal cleavage/methylation domain-containing protein [Candidatus Methylobacter oryzae]|uniref:Prepilin-type N-terminal cleavage/methylation domain-containing protein n=1 Tax=Candidatus Methylobacter oryzae TaxID=2497749 RepID=A0ABY3CGH3_9GAMM|nr:prepilin-type N-terminal cleavage/methylation domain-containing protein [Candidatus Methylobacter oryzae]TRX02944.1 prepilin-type N-terminal cleavage/methylation domain-containing protein [Candidatus Methylobacter oryzae]
MKKQNGFTLIEIMISLLLGLIVLGSTISIYVNTVGSSSDTIKSARLNYDLESLMTLMINDIKRSGYWGGAIIGSDGRTNPFTTAATNINIPVTTSCILYSYDANSDGRLTPTDLTDDVDANEYYGFKLVNNTLSMRKTGTTTNSADCSDGEWEEFVDGSQLTITALTFSFVPMDVNGNGNFSDAIDLSATSRCLNVTTDTVTNAVACAGAVAGDNIAQKRVVNIQLSGRLTSDASITKTLRGTVEVRNSRLFTQ